MSSLRILILLEEPPHLAADLWKKINNILWTTNESAICKFFGPKFCHWQKNQKNSRGAKRLDKVNKNGIITSFVSDQVRVDRFSEIYLNK